MEEPPQSILDSNEIMTFLPSTTSYKRHFWLDSNTQQELMVVGKSSDTSKCISSRYSDCHFLDIFFYSLQTGKPMIAQHCSLPHFEKTRITLDSLSQIVVSRRTEPSGFSHEDKVETFKLRDGRFYLSKVFLSVDTKISSAYSPNEDNWKYLADLTTGQLKVIYSQIRLDTTLADHDFAVKDSIFKTTFPQNPNIQLGTEYNLDSILGEENMIHFY